MLRCPSAAVKQLWPSSVGTAAQLTTFVSGSLHSSWGCLVSDFISSSIMQVQKFCAWPDGNERLKQQTRLGCPSAIVAAAVAAAET